MPIHAYDRDDSHQSGRGLRAQLPGAATATARAAAAAAAAVAVVAIEIESEDVLE